jgi:HAD superfamily hydrolase (TIGR01509 family)
VLKGAFFDAHGILYMRRLSPREVALMGLAARGDRTGLPEAEVARLRALRVEATLGHRSAQAYWSAFLAAGGVTAEAKRTALVQRVLAQAHAVEEVPGAASTLAVLKRRGFVLGVITNTIYPLEWKRAWLARVGVAAVIDTIACSTALGLRKPDPAIYRRALAPVGLEPHEAAFVGHTRCELTGARRAGLVTVAVGPVPDVEADYRVGALPDLLMLPIFQSR